MKEKEILKMLKYLGKDTYQTHIGERTENVFYIGFNIFKCPDKEITSRDHCSTEIDFNKKDITLFACNESHHNGSDYNNIELNYNWINIDIIYDTLANLTKDFLLKEEKARLAQAQAKREEVLADKRFQKFLK